LIFGTIEQPTEELPFGAKLLLGEEELFLRAAELPDEDETFAELHGDDVEIETLELALRNVGPPLLLELALAGGMLSFAFGKEVRTLVCRGASETDTPFGSELGDETEADDVIMSLQLLPSVT
jgi:hypothetical protein